MIVVFSEEFYNDIERITDKKIIERALNAVEKIESASSLRDVSNIKAMQGYTGFYRIRFGDYRIGFQVTDKDTVRILAIDHRSKIYRHFPE
jgi:mRNA interferase RelE/StbE